MATGTKDLRMASIVILNKAKEEKARLENTVRSARIESKVNPVEEWITVSWELEIQLLQNKIDTIEKWIVDDNYDY
jgi:hypothetical protein